MFLRLNRTLLNAADQGGASGNSAAAEPAAPEATAPQAQGDGAVTLTKAELDELISSAAAKAAQAAHDKAYADARRTFQESKKPKSKNEEPAAGPAPLSATDERAFLRGLDRYLAQAGLSPNSSQYARAERDLLSDRPEDVATWAKDYFDGFGGAAKQAATAPQPKLDPVAPHPVSNRGAPAPTQVPLEEADLVTMSEADRKAWISAKGMRAYVTQLQKQLKGRSVAIGR